MDLFLDFVNIFRRIMIILAQNKVSSSVACYDLVQGLSEVDVT